MKNFALGMTASLLLMGCAGFSYRYYGLEDVDYSHGKLIGPKESDDLTFLHCEPSATSKHPCVVLFAPEFFKLKQDLLDTQNKLKKCEQDLAFKQ